MERSNVTVSLPTDLLREARHLAVDQGVSLSGLLARLLQECVEERRRYQEARDRQLQLLEKGLPLGIGDRILWTRDELHER